MTRRSLACAHPTRSLSGARATRLYWTWLLSTRAPGQGPPDDALGAPERVDLRRVDEVDPEVEGAGHDVEGVVLGVGGAVPPLPRTELPRAQPDGRHPDPTHLDVAHRPSLLRYLGCILRPPSRRITSPFRYPFWHRWTTRAAKSSGVPSRFGKGTPAARAWRPSSGSRPSRGVSIAPGAIVRTRIPDGERSRAAGRVMPTTPPLA